MELLRTKPELVLYENCYSQLEFNVYVTEK